MRCYFVREFGAAEAAREKLREMLPGQEDPWVLYVRGEDGPSAYFNVHEVDPDATWDDDLKAEPIVQVDVSGRADYFSKELVGTMTRLHEALGGKLFNDDDEIIGDLPPLCRIAQSVTDR